MQKKINVVDKLQKRKNINSHRDHVTVLRSPHVHVFVWVKMISGVVIVFLIK